MENGGKGLIKSLLKAVRDRGCTIAFDTAAKRVLTDDGGAASGLEVRSPTIGIVRQWSGCRWSERGRRASTHCAPFAAGSAEAVRWFPEVSLTFERLRALEEYISYRPDLLSCVLAGLKRTLRFDRSGWVPVGNWHIREAHRTTRAICF